MSMMMGGPRGPMRRGGHPEKLDKTAVAKLIRYCRNYLPAVIAAMLLAVVSAVATIIGPDKISELMDLISNGLMLPGGIEMASFRSICTFLIVLYAAGALAGYLQQFIMAEVTQRTSRKLRSDINGKIGRLPLSYFDTTTRGDILSRVTNDVDTISQTLGSSVANLVNSGVQFFGVLIMMFSVSAALSGVTILSGLVGFAGMTLILRRSQKYFNARQQNLGQMNGHVEEIYTNLSAVKSYTAEEQAIGTFSSINKELYHITTSHSSLPV